MDNIRICYREHVSAKKDLEEEYATVARARVDAVYITFESLDCCIRILVMYICRTTKTL